QSQARSCKSQLYDLKQSTDTAAVLQRVKALADQLAALNDPISEADLVHQILRGLGLAYRAFTRPLRSQEVPPTYTELHGMILTEELELAAEESSLITTTKSRCRHFLHQRHRLRGALETLCGGGRT
ncbi:hypothetical protein LINPERHAP1_LOCUS8643, partial [Linum perenne]